MRPKIILSRINLLMMRTRLRWVSEPTVHILMRTKPWTHCLNIHQHGKHSKKNCTVYPRFCLQFIALLHVCSAAAQIKTSLYSVCCLVSTVFCQVYSHVKYNPLFQKLMAVSSWFLCDILGKCATVLPEDCGYIRQWMCDYRIMREQSPESSGTQFPALCELNALRLSETFSCLDTYFHPLQRWIGETADIMMNYPHSDVQNPTGSTYHSVYRLVLSDFPAGSRVRHLWATSHFLQHLFDRCIYLAQSMITEVLYRPPVTSLSAQPILKSTPQQAEKRNIHSLHCCRVTKLLKFPHIHQAVPVTRANARVCPQIFDLCNIPASLIQVCFVSSFPTQSRVAYPAFPTAV